MHSLIGSKFGAKEKSGWLDGEKLSEDRGRRPRPVGRCSIWDERGDEVERVAEVYGKIMINSWSLRDTDHYIQEKNLYILTRRESILM